MHYEITDAINIKRSIASTFQAKFDNNTGGVKEFALSIPRICACKIVRFLYLVYATSNIYEHFLLRRQVRYSFY